jgi:hypothetical protein
MATEKRETVLLRGHAGGILIMDDCDTSVIRLCPADEVARASEREKLCADESLRQVPPSTIAVVVIDIWKEVNHG